MELYLYISLGILTVSIAVLFSLHLMSQHLSHYNYPQYQLHICRIIALVPVYGCASVFTMMIPSGRLWFEALRDTYEAFAVYNFLVLMINYCGGERRLELNLEGKPKMNHPWPFSLVLPRVKPGRDFLRFVRAGSLQFVFFRPLLSVAALVFTSQGLYTENYYGLNDAYIYIFLATNLAFAVSLYCLTLFYLSSSDFLHSYNVVSKFLCIKLVVFFCFWQQVLLLFLTNIQVIRPQKGLSAEEKALQINNFLICIEMLFASLGHTYAYAAREFQVNSKASIPRGEIKSIFAPTDLIEDARGYMHPTAQDFELSSKESQADSDDGASPALQGDIYAESYLRYSKI